MNLRGIDLNLLTLLHALLEEQHVSRAAEASGLTQPAMSNALDRCRRLFGDPLLERRGSRMHLTPRGQRLKAPLAAVLTEIGGLVDAKPPTLSEIKRTVSIVVADALAGVLVEPLLASVAEEAPNVRLAFHNWGSGVTAMKQVQEGLADMAVSVFPPNLHSDLVIEPMLDEHYVLAGRAGHPALIPGGIDRWLDFPYAVVSAEGAVRTPFDEQLESQGLRRRVVIAVPSFRLVPPLLTGSDMLALLPSLVLDRCGFDLTSVPPPLTPAGFRLDMVRHPRTRSDVAVAFVSRCVRSILSRYG